MERLLSLLGDQGMQKEVQSCFTIEDGILVIDTDKITKLVSENEEFQIIAPALQTSSDLVSPFSHTFRSGDISAHMLSTEILDKVYLFNGGQEDKKKDVVYTNYFDALVNDQKILLVAYIAVVDDDMILYDGGSYEEGSTYYGFHISHLDNVTSENFTANMRTIQDEKITEFNISKDKSAEIHMCLSGSRSLYSPFILSVAIDRITREEADKYLADNPTVIEMTVGGVYDHLKSGHFIVGQSVVDPIAVGINRILRHEFKGKVG